MISFDLKSDSKKGEPTDKFLLAANIELPVLIKIKKQNQFI
jgi:hypothetical protein